MYINRTMSGGKTFRATRKRMKILSRINCSKGERLSTHRMTLTQRGSWTRLVPALVTAWEEEEEGCGCGGG